MVATIPIHTDDDIKHIHTNPYQPMTQEEFLARLEPSRAQAAEGRCIDANAALTRLRDKYGL